MAMTSEIEVVPATMKLLERSYSTPPGWRLATVKEANRNFQMIKQQKWELQWERARLLDGWISRERDDLQIGDDFRIFLGHMLVIQIQGNSDDVTRSSYTDVTLTDRGRDVALLLCAYDWNYEVIYWLLNFWEKRDTLKVLDMTEGKIPLMNKNRFGEMNRMICHLCRILGEDGLAAQKAAREKPSADSVNEVMVSVGKFCWGKLNEENQKILPRKAFIKQIRESTKFTIFRCSRVNWFQGFASEGDTSDAIWNFIWHYISSSTLLTIVRRSLSSLIRELISKKDQSGRQREFIMSTAILHNLLDYEDDVVSKILEKACKDAAGDDRQRFYGTLKNISSAQYDETGNYHVLNKILIYALRSFNKFLVIKLLEWGVQPQAVLDTDFLAALSDIMAHNDKEIVRSLFDKCDSKENFANAADDKGMTVLHLACRYADISTVQMILQYGGNPDGRDKRGRLPLYYAMENGKEDIVDVLIKRGNSDAVKDNDEISALDLAVQTKNKKLIAKLLSVSKQSPESYFHKVDRTDLLREFASQGNSKFVKKLLEVGADPRACDERGRTALHYASMLEDEDKASDLTELVLDKYPSEAEQKTWMGKRDDQGETALHVVAMKGHALLCDLFCRKNEDIVKVKDANGRGILHEVIERSHHDDPQVISNLLHYWVGGVESIIDHSDLTLLHVAASAGKKYIADALIKMSGEKKLSYLRTPDILGQTALHKAAKEGHVDTVTVLLHHGADPLLERDSEGRTALHCAVQNQAEDQTKEGKGMTKKPKDEAQKDPAIAVAKLLIEKCVSERKKLLFLWASAAGLGTADQMLKDSPLRHFLLRQKQSITGNEGKENNLLRIAACLGDIGMTKELLTRGAQIGDIRDQQWIESLEGKERQNVDTVLKQIQIIAEQGNDQPTISDNLGRSDYAYGLAALLLNPYLKPPIAVGISGSWGMGKSSLMLQTEGILLKTAAQLALLPSETTSSSFPGIQMLELSKNGKRKYHEIKTTVDSIHKEKKLGKKFLGFKNKISKWWRKDKKKTTGTKKGDSLSEFLNQYEPEYHHIFKSLAAMDSSNMFVPDSATEESVPAILTVRYNAWKYRNESEALAGIAVEITKEMEGIMTDAQWLSTCLRNAWRKQKQVIWIEIFFPCLLVVLLAISFTWIVWLFLDRLKIKNSLELKYASFPLTVVLTVWTLIKKVISTVNPVSVQLMNYMKLPDHTEKLGYQEQVIDDIKFLKEEIRKKPYSLCTVASYIWYFIISLLPSKCNGKKLVSSTPSANLRTIVFVDDLDRCQESVILQVLQAINLVLAVCQISVVLGMDKTLIQRAIMNNYGGKSLKSSRRLADKYLQKIIQLPLDLPDPSEDQSKGLLDQHLGVFQTQRKEGHSESETDAEDHSIQENDVAYSSLFSGPEILGEPELDFGEVLQSAAAETGVPVPGTQTADPKDITINFPDSNETNASNSRQVGPIQTLRQTIGKVVACMQLINLFKTSHVQPNLETEDPEEENVAEGDQSLKHSIPIRQLLFITYSQGEQNAFDYFRKMATDIRKLPRERKRLLNYHRLVWNIFLINNEAKNLDGWQVQLITWTFICWEWEKNINIIIENWDRLRDLKEDKPSLRMIVDHFIKGASEKKADTAKTLQNSVETDTTPQTFEGEKKEKGVSTNEGDPESSQSKPSELDVLKDQMIYLTESQGDASNATNELDAPKKETVEIKKQLDRNEKLLAELKEQVESIVNKRQVRRNKKNLKSESWGRLKFALQRYDVSMEGIQAFQEFRFYCVAGYLPWPLPDRKIVEIENEVLGW